MASATDFQIEPSLPIRILAWAAVVFLMLPLVVIVMVSFSSAQYLSFPPPGFSLQWYERFLTNSDWLASIWVSLKVAALSTAMTLILGVLASIVLVRSTFSGKSLMLALLIAPMIVPTIVTAIGIYFMMVKLGLNGTVLAIAIGHSVIVFPLMIIIISATLQDFDIRMEHAAISLGASPVTAFWRVTCPVIAPGLLTASLFAFLTSFDELIVPLFLGGPYSQTLAVRIWNSVMLEIEPTIAAVSTLLIGLAIASMMAASLIKKWSSR